MGVMVILLSVSLTVAIIFLGLFIWSVRTGQFDDDYTPAHQILFENNEVKAEEKETKESKN